MSKPIHHGLPPLLNAMTVDVEDYFQVSAFDGHVTSSDSSITSTI